MIGFDARTAFLIVGLLYLVMPAVAWIVLAGQRSLPAALWCGGGLLTAIGFVMFSMHGHVVDWISLSLANALFLTATLAKIHSLRLDLGLRSRLRESLLAGVLVMLVFEILHHVLGQYVLRALFMTSVMCGLVGYIAFLALRIGRGEPSASAKWISGVYGLLTVTGAFRVTTLLGKHGGDPTLMAEGLSTQLIALAAILSAVIGHFGYVGMALDRSVRRELKAAADLARDEESRRLGKQIAHLDRQRSLGEMSASLGHELNQPLTAILTNAQVALRGLQAGRFDNAQLAGFFDKIIHNTQRASQIIERIRGFIRPSASQRKAVDLRGIVHEVATLVADDIRARQVRLVLPADDSPVMVMADPIQLSQVVLNVLRNAIEALSQTAQPEIHAACGSADGRAILRVRDNGPGLSAEVAEQVGTPFFTTKPTGMGVGVSIARSIAVQHGGTLAVGNAAGGGALVELTLPLLAESLRR